MAETAPEEVLRAAAVEVSTRSGKRRLLLFRQTLPPLLAKATESASDTRLLVDLIFQTLPLYDDLASRKAVDDMVIRALGQSRSMKRFAATLVKSMETNLKGTSPFACFKLLRWSSYLLKWTQVGTLSKRGFSKLANAQAVLSEVLMVGSFRQRLTCKQLFIRIFSESVEIYKMYIEEVRDLRILVGDCPTFINLILDFTINSSSLSSDYKPVFLDLYVRTILSSVDPLSEAASEAFAPLFLDIGDEEFKNVVLPSCIKMLKRSPEIVLQSIRYLLMTVRLDLSNYSMEFMPIILHQARHSDKERRINALNILASLSDKSRDLDTLSSMFNAIKEILGGSEGTLSLPGERAGMLNALEQLSKSSLKQISRLAPSVCSFLVTYYKGDVTEEVKLAALSALGSWHMVSSEAVQPEVVSFIAEGLREKDLLRNGHLKLIRDVCKKSNSVTKVTSLLDHLIQLSKTGFTKKTERLNGIYALYAVSRLAAIDAKADYSVMEKLWTLIAKSEPSVISVQLLSTLTDEDCFTCADLLDSLLVDNSLRIQEYFSRKSLLQVLIYLVCHPSWNVRKIAYDVTKKVLSSPDAFAEDILFLFDNLLSLVGEGVSILQHSSGNSQLPFTPSTEVVVKCLFLLAPHAVGHNGKLYSRLILCSHHPYISSSSSPAGVWKRLQRRLKREKIVLKDLILPNISTICKELLSNDRLFSSNKQEQCAALRSLSTLMTISPNDTSREFENLFIELGLSVNDIKIFFTPEQGIYDADAVPSKNSKLQDLAKIDTRGCCSIGKRETANVDKFKTAEEDARKVALMLEALGELAISHPTFTQKKLLPHPVVKYIIPLLSAPLVSDSAFCAMLRMARSTDFPLRNWASGIAAAIRVMAVEDSNSSGFFKEAIHILNAAFKVNPLPEDSFTSIFQMIIGSLKKTSLHDVLKILTKHLDLVLPPSRLIILQVVYHLISTVQRDLQLQRSLWIGFHDPDKAVAGLACQLRDFFGFDVCTDYSGISESLSHKNYNVRAAAANALTAALHKNPDKMQDSLSTLFSLYNRDLGSGVGSEGANDIGREGVALALYSIADVLGSKDLPIIMQFLTSTALADPILDIRDRMISSCIRLIDKHEQEIVSLLFPILESYMKNGSPDEKTYSLFRKSYMLFTGAVAQSLAKDEPEAYISTMKLLDVLRTSAVTVHPLKMHVEFSYEPLLSHIKSGGSLFDVVKFKGAVAKGLPGNYFVSLGEKGRNIYNMIFRLLETYHCRNRCVRRYTIKDLRYVSTVNCLLFSEDVKEQPFCTDSFCENILDAGSVLENLRYSPAKLLAEKEHDILELDRSQSFLPPYLAILVQKTKTLKASAKEIHTAKWRSSFRLDLAGKSPNARLRLVLGVDCHRDYLLKREQTEFDNCLGVSSKDWTMKAKPVPSLNDVLCYKIPSGPNTWVKQNYDGTSIQSLWSCGRNHQSHANKSGLSDKEAEAIFSLLYHKELSSITKVLLHIYREPLPEENKEENRFKIMQILNTE